MLDFEIIKVRCPYAARTICHHPRTQSHICAGVNCTLTDKQYKELILGEQSTFIPYTEMRQN